MKATDDSVSRAVCRLGAVIGQTYIGARYGFTGGLALLAVAVAVLWVWDRLFRHRDKRERARR